MKRLYYLGKPGDGFGWGVANTNLSKELAKICDLVVDESARDKFDAPVFVPVIDHDLSPFRAVRNAPRIIGYCFTEWPLGEKAERTARQYDVLFAGSDWNTEKLRRHGIKQAQTLHQGIDFDLFKLHPACDRKGFVVFSGGKFEFRKGQDYVITAMRLFMKLHPDAVLLTAWHNPWPQTIASMNKSWMIDWKEPLKDMPLERIIQVPAMPNANTPNIYKLSHVGLFPNRCEAGTNLVMCEFMAIGRPVIASYAHGHRDVLGGDGPFLLKNGSYDAAGWFNCNISDILWHLETAYADKKALAERGRACAESVQYLTWSDCARKIYEASYP